MLKIHKFIRCLNVYLLFIVLVAFIVMMVDEFWPNPPLPEPEIEIAESESLDRTSHNNDELADIEFLRLIEGNAIFALRRDYIYPIRGGEVLAMSPTRFYGGDNVRPDRSIVNIMVSKRDHEPKKVFEEDRWIVAIEYPRKGSEYTPKLSRILLNVISEDTNSDGYLRMDDDIDLYAVDSDGGKLQLIMDGIESFDILEQDILMIRKSSDLTVEYIEYDLAENTSVRRVSENRRNL